MSTPAPAVKKQINPLLAKYLLQLATHPLRTKVATGGTLYFLQEIIASHLAGVPPSKSSKYASPIVQSLAAVHINTKTLKMAAYGAFISAPVSHYLVGILQRIFAGKTGQSARAAQILCSNIFIAPIQTVVYLASMAVINGAKSLKDVKKAVKGSFMAVIRVTWVASPLLTEIARKYLPVELWAPFISIAQLIIGTYFATKMKRVTLAAAARKAEQERKEQAEKGEEQP